MRLSQLVRPLRWSAAHGFAGTVGLVLLVACGSDPPAGPSASGAGGPETEAFIADLRQAGASVAKVEQLSQPCFSVADWRLEVDGSSVYVWEYATAVQAEQQAAGISRDGYTTGLCQVEWVSVPHFFKKGRLIVLYVGTDPAILDLLQRVLGAEFAGG